ncbi:MAG: formate dehydrogenase accessory sulfurtransferase FdhD, partial [Oscillospiraceae bacterium]|nr:formate dehydrogenase accessory sulfurtransferase FdhD [Oscillospiraceae bacterium]
MNKKESNAIRRQIAVFQNGSFQTEERELAEEVSYQLIVNHIPVRRLSCSPWGQHHAAIGALYMSGSIQCAEDISQIELQESTGEIHILTKKEDVAPVGAASSPPLPIPAREICQFAVMLEERSLLFQRTGGVHCAALARNGEFLSYAEDISRHAAVDKAAGICLEQNLPMKDSILVFSGRVPGEIVHKADKMGCCAIVARSAPTDYACQLAEEKGITLIGFAREDSFNVYSCHHQIAEAV